MNDWNSCMSRFRKILLYSILFFFNSQISCVTASDTLSCWKNSPSPSKSRLRILNYSAAGLYPLTMTWLYSQWYKDYPQSSFHFFNDNLEWQQMDKFGHVWDAYSIAKPLTHCYQWAGYDNNKATYYACGIAFLYQTTIEVFDGFSAEWGFSTGDLFCNTVGVALFGSQQLFWKEQRVTLKYSFHQTEFAKYRPELLGTNLAENILKDYNGLTYWLCVNPRSFLPENSRFPKWLNIAIGFGADGMTGGKENPDMVNGMHIPQFRRLRQYYLALDLNLSKINTRYYFLNSIFRVINIVHIPAPAIEFSSIGKSKVKWLYF